MLDKQGYPAILHAFVVMLAAGEEYDRSPIPVTREEFMAAAVLHDVVEDTEYTLAYILEQFGPVVANIVDGVTRRKLEKEVYVDFIVRAWQGEASRRLKRVDVTINMKRIHTLPKSEQGIRDRYNRALLILDPWRKYKQSSGDPARHNRSEPDNLKGVYYDFSCLILL